MIPERLIRDILYPLACLRSGEKRLRYLREYERSQYYGTTGLSALAHVRLIALLAHAYAQCPFYAVRYREAGVSVADASTTRGFQHLPLLEKHHIQEYRNAMIAQSWPRNDLVENMTGGSTGTPLSFFLSGDRLESRAGATWRHNRWAGYDIGTKAALLWGAKTDLPAPTWKQRARNWCIDRTIALNTACITEDGLKQFYANMLTFKPAIMVAYANAAALFARFVKDVGSVPLRSVITTAEVLEDADRLLIEEAFCCKVFNRYGCREVSLIASECEQHDGLHIMAEGLIVEIIHGNRQCEPGEIGEVVVTDLLNYAMPLIRYRIGDMAAYHPEPCACGRGLPRLKQIAGRVTGFLVGCDGRLVSGAALTITIVAARPRLGQVQLRQEARGQVLCRIATRSDSPPTECDYRFLTAEIRKYLGQDTRVDVERVDKMVPEASGKFIFSHSRVAQEMIEGGHCATLAGQ